MRSRFLLCLAAIVMIAFPASADDNAVLFHEDFSSLGSWKPFTFPKIKSHSTYTIERDGDRHVLRTESDASASAIVYREPFLVSEHPRVRWRWKVRNIYAKADVRSKQGDDYPLRVYVMFEYEPDKAGFGESVKYGLAKSLYGEYPPHSSLSYVWASREDPDRFVISPYTDRAMMVLLETGPAKAGTWVDEEIDILADYRKAFKKAPPARARIAIMNDSDNTGERAVSWMEFIEVTR
ncbi:MAG: DUF3047 domain-containing protein [Nitrospirota bacterium]|nr:DUF3047 domain-containing protein [Nitrospirota bacterium]